jgi:RNA polymerase sigma-70 factor (ECF subfamily)
MQKRDLICDFELITRIKEGDEAAFRLVFDSYSSKLFYFSLKFLKDKESCQEVVQEVFTRRLTLNVLRQLASSQSAMEKMWLNFQTTTNETEEHILLEDLERFTEQVLGSLPKQQQLVYRMSRQQELSYDEIAEELNISRNTVKNHLVSALKTLRTQLQKAFSILY